MRRTTITTLAVAGALGVASLGAVAVSGPALAAATTTATTDSTESTDGSDSAASRLADRITAIKDALSGLVGDGTITQDQADSVASTLGESDALHGPGGHGGDRGIGMGLDTAATTLGMTEDEVHTALESGKTLSDLAADQGVEEQKLIDDLVAAATTKIDERVAAGDLTQERADALEADLGDRITEMVQDGRPEGGRGHDGPGGRGGPGGPGGHGDGSADGSTDGSSDGSSGSSTQNSVYSTT